MRDSCQEIKSKRDEVDLTETEYYKPNEIHFSREQIEWLIPLLPLLRNGVYPRDPKETGFYDTPVGKRQIKAKAGFISAAEIAAELDFRLQMCNSDGLFLEMVYSQPDDKVFVMQHIASALKVDINIIDRDIERALRYISGYRRKSRSYYQWKNHKGRRNNV